MFLYTIPLKHKEKGNLGENFSSEFLIRKGFIFISRNFRSPYGEVDIVLKTNNCLVFVEVKCWDFLKISDLGDVINKRKRDRIIKTSLYFLQKNKYYKNYSLRYDVCLLQPKLMKFLHIENAFEEEQI